MSEDSGSFVYEVVIKRSNQILTRVIDHSIHSEKCMKLMIETRPISHYVAGSLSTLTSKKLFFLVYFSAKQFYYDMIHQNPSKIELRAGDNNDEICKYTNYFLILKNFILLALVLELS